MDHNPHGDKLQRRAIQLGLKGEILRQFCKEWIISIQDITEFVHEQGHRLKNDFGNLEVIKEEVYLTNSSEVKSYLSLSK